MLTAVLLMKFLYNFQAKLKAISIFTFPAKVKMNFVKLIQLLFIFKNVNKKLQQLLQHLHLQLQLQMLIILQLLKLQHPQMMQLQLQLQLQLHIQLLLLQQLLPQTQLTRKKSTRFSKKSKITAIVKQLLAHMLMIHLIGILLSMILLISPKIKPSKLITTQQLNLTVPPPTKIKVSMIISTV